MEKQLFANIIVATRGIANVPFFTYSVSEELQNKIKQGQLVLIPWRNSQTTGIIWSITNQKPAHKTIKPITKILDLNSTLSKYHLKLALRLSQFYLSTLSEATFAQLPSFFKNRRRPLFDHQSPEINTITPTKIFRPFLLIGSLNDRLQTYERAISRAIEHQKTALLILPDWLAAKMAYFFFKRKFKQIVFYHSAAKNSSIIKIWQQVRDNQYNLIIGERSALSLPILNLGLIMVDAEQERTYKSRRSPKYWTPKAAKFLARSIGANLILGSAAPSLESYYQSQKNKTIKIESIDQKMSSLEILDQHDEHQKRNYSPLAEKILDYLGQIHQNQQNLLIIAPRKGSYALVCRDCQEILRCPACHTVLTYYHATQKLVCHHCHREDRIYRCPTCQSAALKPFGFGTENMEILIKQRFPATSIARFDQQLLQTQTNFNQLITHFNHKTIQVIIATSAIMLLIERLKPDLVDLILPDYLLNLPDFQNQLQIYQMITNIRRTAKHLIIQTESPNHLIFKNLNLPLPVFYQQELARRRQDQLPPFSTILKLNCLEPDPEKARVLTKNLTQKLNKYQAEFEIMEVLSHNFAGQKKFQVIVIGKNPQKLFSKVPIHFKVDVEPISLV